jgi:hypothetical protein
MFAAAGFILAIAFTTAAHTGWAMIGAGIVVAIGASATGMMLRPRVEESGKGGAVTLLVIAAFEPARIHGDPAQTEGEARDDRGGLQP